MKNKVLTQREIRVVFEVLKGKTNDEIGMSLFISRHTVKAHLRSIFVKVGVKTKCELILKVLDKLNDLSKVDLNKVVLDLG